jgi:hypothetical protein
LADPAGPALTFRFVAGPDVDACSSRGPTRRSPNGGAGHFNVLPGHLGLDTGMPLGIVDGTLTDLAVARLFLRRAAEAGLGTLLRYR